MEYDNHYEDECLEHYSDECLEHYIKGKVIKSFEVSEDKSELIIKAKPDNNFLMVYPTETYTFKAWGDCCSGSWIESVINKENIINEKIINIKYLELPDDYPFPKNNEDEEEIYSVFGHSLISKKGHCDLILYNVSNGYYGGELVCEHHYNRLEGI